MPKQSTLGALLKRIRQNYETYRRLDKEAKSKLCLVWVDIFVWSRDSIAAGNYRNAKEACKDIATALSMSGSTAEVYRRYGQYIHENKINPKTAPANSVKAASNAERSVDKATRLKILDAVKKGRRANVIEQLRRKGGRARKSNVTAKQLRTKMRALLVVAKMVYKGDGIQVAILDANRKSLEEVG